MILLPKIGPNAIKAMLSVIDQGIVSATNFSVAFFLARALTVRDFGLYIILFTVWLFVNNLQIGFINQGLLVLINNEDDDYQRNIPVVQIIFSGLIFISLLLISIPVSYINDTFSFLDLLIISSVMTLKTLKEYARNYSLAQLKILRTLLYDTLFMLITIIPVFLSYSLNRVSLLRSWGYFGIAAIAVIVLDIILNDYQNTVEFKRIKSVWLTNLELTKWTTLTNILIWGNANLYKFVVTGFLGIETLAAVGAAQYVTFLLNPLLSGMQNFGTAYLSKKKNESISVYKKSLKAYSLFLITVVSVILLPMLLVPELFFKLFYGDKYLEHGLILQIFAVSLILSVFSRLLNMDLLVRKISKSIFHIYITSVSITLLLLWFLLVFMNYNGLLLFLFLRNIIVFGVTYLWSKKVRTS